MMVAAAFGLASALSVVVLGDESGYLADLNQKMKIAAIEGQWVTQPAPASLTLVGWPNEKQHETQYAIKVPYLLGLIATRSLHTPVSGILTLVKEAHSRIEDGMVAYNALTLLLKNPNDKEAEMIFNIHQENLGYGLLLKRYTEDVAGASPDMIDKAAWDTVPHVGVLFWSFRVMAGLGFYFILLFGMAYYCTVRRRTLNKPWFLWLALLSLPLPWLASEVGWVVAEYGRQPWVVEGQLPTFLAVSSLPLRDLWISISGFIFFYTALAVIEIYLMVKYIRLGPEALFKPAAFEVKKVESLSAR